MQEGSIIKEEIWIEKYRPVRLDDIVGQDEIVRRLKSYVKTKNLPHLLFSGPPGVGKTAAAISIVREIYGEAWRNNFIELNASDERGIEIIRHKVKDFARMAPLGDADFKVIFLDEADALTNDAQSALRRTMERYSATTRFILSCNYSSKIIEPIQSRCAVYRFRALSAEAVRKRIEFIAAEEKLTVSEGGLSAIEYVAGGDMRKAINALQAAALLGDRVDEETIYQITSTARPEEIKSLIRTAMSGDFAAARSTLDDLLLSRGLSGQDVVIQIHRAMLDMDIPDRDRVRLIDRIGEIDFRLTEGANERIQLEALLAYFALNVS
ncbi:MAG TPA: replication factor C small subunit [Methanothrix sp.]|nr:replication factor C small subunit [Methanothrix sp.]HPC88953.1 replication factor C small subunit [Methanothrix sp.]HQE86887.1 replication factor C small subunit [Methanothrix sp.]HQI69020.1 replication factor C small subunit [Methanothrix sp.]HRS85179.1 replication factor C small subunit [Methanothrix sp.]